MLNNFLRFSYLMYDSIFVKRFICKTFIKYRIEKICTLNSSNKIYIFTLFAYTIFIIEHIYPNNVKVEKNKLFKIYEKKNYNLFLK